MSQAQKYKNPVVVIAVNSGNSVASVKSYATAHNVTIPIIVDKDRSFEKAAGVGTISTRNIWQPRILTADGKWTSVGSNEELDALVAQSKWKIEPDTVPESLKEVWTLVEYGHMAKAAEKLAKIKKPKENEVEVVGKLREAVNTYIADLVAQAEAGTPWESYKIYTNLTTDLKKSITKEQTTTFKDKLKTLKKNSQVKKELAAQKALDRVLPKFETENPKKLAAAKAEAQKIADKYPGTEAGEKAKALAQ